MADHDDALSRFYAGECVTHHVCDCIKAERDELREVAGLLAEALRKWGRTDKSLRPPPPVRHVLARWHVLEKGSIDG